MRTLESLRNSCVDGNNDVIHNTVSTIPAGIVGRNVFIPVIILVPGRYIIESKVHLKFDPSTPYDNATDSHRVDINYRIYNPDPDIVDTDYIILNNAGRLYSATATNTFIMAHSNITSEFDINQDVNIKGVLDIETCINYAIECSIAYLNTSTISIKIIKLF